MQRGAKQTAASARGRRGSSGGRRRAESSRGRNALAASACLAASGDCSCVRCSHIRNRTVKRVGSSPTFSILPLFALPLPAFLSLISSLPSPNLCPPLPPSSVNAKAT